MAAPTDKHVFDPQAIRELALYFARAAVDEVWAEEDRQASGHEEPKQNCEAE